MRDFRAFRLGWWSAGRHRHDMPHDLLRDSRLAGGCGPAAPASRTSSRLPNIAPTSGCSFGSRRRRGQVDAGAALLKDIPVGARTPRGASGRGVTLESYLWIMLGSALGRRRPLRVLGARRAPLGRDVSLGHAGREHSRAPLSSALPTWPSSPARRAPARHGGPMRRLHDILRLQPADAEPRPRRRRARAAANVVASVVDMPRLGLARPHRRRRFGDGAGYDPVAHLATGCPAQSAAIYFWIALGSGIGGVARLWCARHAALAVRGGVSVGHPARQHRRLARHRLLLHPHRPRRPLTREHDNAPVRHDGPMRWLHDILGLQPRHAQPDARRQRFAAGANVVLSVALCLLSVAGTRGSATRRR